MRWTAVVNPGAGRGRRARDVARLADALVVRGVDIRVTATADEGREAASGAFARGEGVLACGGDGTVRGLAELAADVDGLLAVVPLGAGNDFARALGLDHRRALDAVALLDDGRETRVDLGRIETADGARTSFTTVAHSGLDGEVNRWANTVRRLSGTALYAAAALRTMATYRPTTMSVTVDGERSEGPTWLVAVGNTRCYGGGMQIAPEARLDDGRLDVVVAGAVSRARLLATFPRMTRGHHLGVAGVVTRRGTRIELDGPAGQDVWASGERVGPLPARIEVRPAALRVLVPPASDLNRLGRGA